jgi:hypothetical protein
MPLESVKRCTALQIRAELELIRSDIASNSETEIRTVLREVVVAYREQKATSEAWQAKFQQGAVEAEKLQADLKRAQVSDAVAHVDVGSSAALVSQTRCRDFVLPTMACACRLR